MYFKVNYIEPTSASNKSPPPTDPRIEWIDPIKITRGFNSIKKSRMRSSSVSRDNLLELRQHMVNSATSFSARLGRNLFYLFGSAASFGVARLLLMTLQRGKQMEEIRGRSYYRLVSRAALECFRAAG